MAYLTLAVAILCEVIATSCLRASAGFTRPLPIIVALAGYGIAFWCLSLTLRTVPTGIAYAIWSGVGIVLIAAAGWLFAGQRLDPPALLGMALVVAGVLVMTTLSKASV
ncbi:DMT family transporter [Sphingomonas jatrophae]|uniref:Small multidrug resistance pump n=1 Tax=Sphingomonas jatrophae TaxID=1166337 RepID=A0A1I6L0V7_9SPHN|nr:multidrug efflux SMR transporter [Sphingomonas jatrophae]SFR97081.1 small multidrug resistance pump [Sphingomonas jatrophae]